MLNNVELSTLDPLGIIYAFIFLFVNFLHNFMKLLLGIFSRHLLMDGW